MTAFIKPMNFVLGNPFNKSRDYTYQFYDLLPRKQVRGKLYEIHQSAIGTPLVTRWCPGFSEVLTHGHVNCVQASICPFPTVFAYLLLYH